MKNISADNLKVHTFPSVSASLPVIPAKAGIQVKYIQFLDPCFRRDDDINDIEERNMGTWEGTTGREFLI